MKYLELLCEDGSRYRIPAQIIAENRARYYAEKDGGTDTYADELAYTLSSDYELTDWATGNMNWPDVEAVAVKVESAASLDMQEQWNCGEKEIVDDD